MYANATRGDIHSVSAENNVYGRLVGGVTLRRGTSDTQVRVTRTAENTRVACISICVVIADLVESIQAVIAVHAGIRVQVVCGTFVVPFKIAFHAAKNTKIVLFEIPSFGRVIISVRRSTQR